MISQHLQAPFTEGAKLGAVPLIYKIHKAARVLNHSTIDLAEREDFMSWIGIAATLEQGENEATYLNNLNHKYWYEAFKYGAEVDKVKEIARKMLGK